jgi:hypothetical protein
MNALDKGFQETAKKSDEECTVELELLRIFLSGTRHFVRGYMFSTNQKKKFNDLFSWCLIKSVEECGSILFLVRNGLYRNAFDSIRHILESTIQSVYLDSNYVGINNIFLSRPDPNIFVKIAILSEVEDKREYHVTRLIDVLDIGYKDRIKRIYKELSQMVHPSHKQIEKIMESFTKPEKGLAKTVDCKEIEVVFKSLVNVYDVLLFLFFTLYPEDQKTIVKKEEFISFVKESGFFLTPKILKIK